MITLQELRKLSGLEFDVYFKQALADVEKEIDWRSKMFNKSSEEKREYWSSRVDSAKLTKDVLLVLRDKATNFFYNTK